MVPISLRLMAANMGSTISLKEVVTTRLRRLLTTNGIPSSTLLVTSGVIPSSKATGFKMCLMLMRLIK